MSNYALYDDLRLAVSELSWTRRDRRVTLRWIFLMELAYGMALVVRGLPL